MRRADIGGLDGHRHAAGYLGDERRVIGSRGDAGAFEAVRGDRSEYRLHVLGGTMSRPAIIARARAARVRPCPARGDNPIWMSLRRRASEQAWTYSSSAGAMCPTGRRLQLARPRVERWLHAGQQVAPIALGEQRSCAASG